MKNAHIVIIALAFITVLVSLYYGVSIQNAQDNFLITDLYLNEGVTYFDVDYVPTLSYKAAIVTLMFLTVGFCLQAFVFYKTPFKRVKKLAIVGLLCYLIIFVFDFLTICNPHFFNFKTFGMIWVTLSLTTIFINFISAFIRK